MFTDEYGHSPDWGSFFKGLGRIITGIFALATGIAVLASGVALLPMLIVGGITVAAGLLTLVNGAADIGQGFSGYNFMRDGVFGGNQTAYNWYSGVVEGVAAVGSIISGGWLRYNRPRISAYKNIGNYEFSGTLSKADHMSRSYQHSTLLQKNIIKYGRMVKESSGLYNFTIGGAYKIGWVSYGVGKAGSHPVTWKLVLDIGKQIIFHAGF